jgi:dTDP-glucose 4,6-dehydratase
MIFFGSAEVYGDYDGVMKEDVVDTIPIKQMNDYAISKWANELQILNSAKMHGTENVRVRLFNVYGPHEHYSPYRGAVPVFIYSALHNRPYTVYRGHKRTFEFVEDIARTLILCRSTQGKTDPLSSSRVRSPLQHDSRLQTLPRPREI